MKSYFDFYGIVLFCLRLLNAKSVRFFWMILSSHEGFFVFLNFVRNWSSSSSVMIFSSAIPHSILQRFIVEGNRLYLQTKELTETFSIISFFTFCLKSSGYLGFVLRFFSPSSPNE